MNYVEPVFRPPSEANSYILQITYGCSYNKCAFCGMYKTKKFTLRPMDDILEDIYEGGELFPDTRRVFLADGDAFILETEILTEILSSLNKAFPALQRVGIYANPKGILSKTEEELRILKELKLTIAYLGLESGYDKLLELVNKGSTAEDMIKSAIKAQNCGIKISAMILLGLGGYEYSEIHSKKTAEAINKMEPRYLSVLTLMVVPGTLLFEKEKKGDFILPEDIDILRELKMIIQGLDLKKTIFRSNHASNYLPLKGRFPRDKEFLIASLNYSIKNINNKNILIPNFLRGL